MVGILAASPVVSAVLQGLPGMVGLAGGTFEMGSHYIAVRPNSFDVQRIVDVTVSPFAMGETPVTNAQFRRFLAAQNVPPPFSSQVTTPENSSFMAARAKMAEERMKFPLCRRGQTKQMGFFQRHRENTLFRELSPQGAKRLIDTAIWRFLAEVEANGGNIPHQLRTAYARAVVMLVDLVADVAIALYLGRPLFFGTTVDEVAVTGLLASLTIEMASPPPWTVLPKPLSLIPPSSLYDFFPISTIIEEPPTKTNPAKRVDHARRMVEFFRRLYQVAPDNGFFRFGLQSWLIQYGGLTNTPIPVLEGISDFNQEETSSPSRRVGFRSRHSKKELETFERRLVSIDLETTPFVKERALKALANEAFERGYPFIARAVTATRYKVSGETWNQLLCSLSEEQMATIGRDAVTDRYAATLLEQANHAHHPTAQEELEKLDASQWIEGAALGFKNATKLIFFARIDHVKQIETVAQKESVELALELHLKEIDLRYFGKTWKNLAKKLPPKLQEPGRDLAHIMTVADPRFASDAQRRKALKTIPPKLWRKIIVHADSNPVAARIVTIGAELLQRQDLIEKCCTLAIRSPLLSLAEEGNLLAIRAIIDVVHVIKAHDPDHSFASTSITKNLDLKNFIAHFTTYGGKDAQLLFEMLIEEGRIEIISNLWNRQMPAWRRDEIAIWYRSFSEKKVRSLYLLSKSPQNPLMALRNAGNRHAWPLVSDETITDELIERLISMVQAPDDSAQDTLWARAKLYALLHEVDLASLLYLIPRIAELSHDDPFFHKLIGELPEAAIGKLEVAIDHNPSALATLILVAHLGHEFTTEKILPSLNITSYLKELNKLNSLQTLDDENVKKIAAFAQLIADLAPYHDGARSFFEDTIDFHAVAAQLNENHGEANLSLISILLAGAVAARPDALWLLRQHAPAEFSEVIDEWLRNLPPATIEKFDSQFLSAMDSGFLISLLPYVWDLLLEAGHPTAHRLNEEPN